MQLTPAQAKKRAEAAWRRKDLWTSTLGDAMRIVHPHRDGFYRYAEGQKKEGQGQTWDATASLASVRGANQLVGLTPPFEDWITLEPGPAAELALGPDELHDLKVKLEATAKACNAMAQTGDFGSAVHEMWLDFLYSTGAMTVDPNPDPFGPIAIFRAVPLSEFMVEEGPFGTVDTWHRRFEIAARTVQQTWPDATIEDGGRLAAAIKGHPERPVKLFEITYRDYDERDRPWRYEVFFSNGKDCERIVERRERTSRWMTPRNTKVAGETLGRGPLLQSMPDIRTINTVVELTMRAASLALLGIYTTTDDAMNTNTVRLRPGNVIKVRANGGPSGPTLQRLDDPNVRLDFANVLLDEMRMRVKEALFDSGLPPDAGPVRSATEIVQRMRQLAVDLGGAYGRVVNEFILPFVQRLIDILALRKVIPEGLSVDQFFIRVKVTSQVARAQQFATVEAIVRWLEILMTFGGREAILASAAIEQLGAELAKFLGVPANLVRPPAQVQETLAKVQGIAQRQVAGQLVEPGGQALPEAA